MRECRTVGYQRLLRAIITIITLKSLCHINFNIDVESQYHLTEIVNKLYIEAINKKSFDMHLKYCSFKKILYLKILG